MAEWGAMPASPARLLLPLLAIAVPAVLPVMALAGCPARAQSSLTVTRDLPLAVTASAAPASHGDTASPDPTAIFPADRVVEAAIAITPADWAALQADMAARYGPPGQGLPSEGAPKRASEKPIWVRATVRAAGHEWRDVAIRLKGQSSLFAAWYAGTDKLPFKLDFARLAPTQTCYGYRELELAPNFNDPTGLREALGYAAMGEAGLAAARTGFWSLTLDHGTGPRRLGLYTMVEGVADTVVTRAFGTTAGSLYQPEGDLVGLAPELRGRLRASFELERGVGDAAWQPLEAMEAALHDPLRATDPAAWRAAFDQTFDVDGFLTCMALGAALQSWDTYGFLAHNFYLFAEPAGGRIRWIPFDLNLILGGALQSDLQLDRADAPVHWTLIRWLLDDPFYGPRYKLAMASLAEGPASPAKLEARLAAWKPVVAPVVTRETSTKAFEQGYEALVTVVRARGERVRAYVSSPSK